LEGLSKRPFRGPERTLSRSRFYFVPGEPDAAGAVVPTVGIGAREAARPNATRCFMVNPTEIMPILAMALTIACIPILGDGPFRQDDDRMVRERGSRPRRPQ